MPSPTASSTPCEACLDAEVALAEHDRRARDAAPSGQPRQPGAHAWSEVIRLTAEVERLTSLLAIYGEHKVSCPQRHSYLYGCTCGWKEARP